MSQETKSATACMRPADFRTLRKGLGVSWGPKHANADEMDSHSFSLWQISIVANALNMNEKTIRVWERDGGRGPHPTAVRVLKWWQADLIRPRGVEHDMDAAALADARFELGLSIDALAYVLDVTPETLQVWEGGRGPHPPAMTALACMLDGFEPPELQEFLEAQD